MAEAKRCIKHSCYLTGCQLQHLQSGLLGYALQACGSQIYDTVEIELVYDRLCDGPVLLQEYLTCCSDLLNCLANLIQAIQVECQVSCQIHIGEAGGHSEGLVMGLRCQVDSKAVVSVICQLGKSSLMVAGHEQMIQVFADCLSVLYCAQGLR